MSNKKTLAWALAAPFWILGGDAKARDLDPKSTADNYAKVWVTLDADRVGVRAWAGTTFSLPIVDLAANVVLIQNYPGVVDPLQGSAFAEQIGSDYRAPSVRIELGPALASGGFFFLPKIGLGYDFARTKVMPLVPQLLSIVQGGPLYVESWVQFFFYDMFEAGAQDSFYTRDLLLLAFSNSWAVGAQVEVTLAIRNAPSTGALRSLPVGARVNFSPASPVTFGLFAGYETKTSARNSEHDFLSGRFTVALIW